MLKFEQSSVVVVDVMIYLVTTRNTYTILRSENCGKSGLVLPMNTLPDSQPQRLCLTMAKEELCSIQNRRRSGLNWLDITDGWNSR